MVVREYQGFDMDIIRAVAKEMGYKADIQNLNFDGLIPAMESGNIDVIAAGMSINENVKLKLTLLIHIINLVLLLSLKR